MEPIETQTTPIQEQVSERTKSEKKRGVSLASPLIRVELPKEVALRVERALLTLKERKASVKVEELLAPHLEGITEEYLNEQIQSKTPDAFYLELAHEMPELRKLMIEKAKKAFQSTKKEPPSDPALPKEFEEHFASYFSGIRSPQMAKKEREAFLEIKARNPDVTDTEFLECFEIVSKDYDAKGEPIGLKFSWMAKGFDSILKRARLRIQGRGAVLENKMEEGTEEWAPPPPAFMKSIGNRLVPNGSCSEDDPTDSLVKKDFNA